MPDFTDRDVLCVRTADLEAALPPPVRPLYPGADPVLNGLLVARPPLWLTRTPALEVDPGVVQVVAYVLVRSRGLYAAFRRTREAGEGRLHGRITLGLGGHVERQDAKGVGPHGAILRAAFRELEEEVDLSQPPHSVPRAGLIYDPSEPVSARHLGAVFLADHEHSSLEVLDPGLEHLGWFAPQVLRDHGYASRADVEPWSRIVLRHVVLRDPAPA